MTREEINAAIERAQQEAERYGPRHQDPEILADIREQLEGASFRFVGENPANSANDTGDGPETDPRF